MGQPGIALVTLAVASAATAGNLYIARLQRFITDFCFHSITHDLPPSRLLPSKFRHQIFSHLKLNENKIRIRYTIYKYKNIKQSKDGI
jgi:hypothetical protein